MLQFLGMLGAIALTAICWGVYGPVLHFGREAMASPLRPFVCVGMAYFLIAVLIPFARLLRKGERGQWSGIGVFWSLLAGASGALGALGVILALHYGGKPIFVMPLVFGGAPVVNTLLTAVINKSFNQLKAPFLAGLILVIAGAVTVLVFKPQQPAHTVISVPIIEVLLAVALSVVCWGAYGPVLHRGQLAMDGSRLRPLICIGAAYFLIAVLVPLALLVPLGDSGSWDIAGCLWSLAAGSLGAVGALGAILAFACGGKPFTVMPVVFGCAPVINTLTTLAFAHTPRNDVSPWFLAGMLVVGLGAATVLIFGPRGHAPVKQRMESA